MSSIRELAFAKAIGGGGSGGDISVESLSVTANGQYSAPSGKAYSPVSVNVQPTLQSKTITENGTVTADAGYDGLSSVTVNVSGGGSVSDNDLLFHFDNGFENSGKSSVAFLDVRGLAISNEQSKFGGKSLKSISDGGVMHVSKNLALSYDIAFGTQDFTLDFWIYPMTLSSYASPFAFSYTSLGVFLKKGKYDICVSIYGNSWNIDHEVNKEIELNTWHHIAIVRSDAVIYSFFDGIKITSDNIGSNPIANVSNLTFGNSGKTTASDIFDGYIDEFRLKLGQAVWTDDFTPPTEPYV